VDDEVGQVLEAVPLPLLSRTPTKLLLKMAVR